MKALVYKKRSGVRFVEDYPTPKPARGEALIRVRLAGVCDTDIEITRGYMDYEGVLGHEFVGEIHDCADRSLVGVRVVGEINCPCGKCALCKAGLGNHCATRSVLGIFKRDGCFAEFLTLPTKNLYPIPDNVSDEAAVFVEPLAAALRIEEQIEIDRNDEIAVLGDGKLGLLAAMALGAEHKKRVRIFGHHRANMELLQNYDVQTALADDAGKERFDVVVDCTGNAAGFRQAMAMTRPQGILVLKSTFASSDPLNLAPLVIDEITLVGSRCGPFAPALKALEKGTIDPRPMISRMFDIERGETALAFAQQKGSLKVLIHIGDEGAD